MPSHYVKLLRAALTASLVLVAIAEAAVAVPFEDYIAVYNRGDYAIALRLIRPLADQGNADAQYNLGVLYEKGQGVPQDYAEAVKWYRALIAAPRRFPARLARRSTRSRLRLR